MKKDTSNQQKQAQTPAQVQTQNERPQSLQPETGNEDIARRAYAIYEERGGIPGSELDDWLQAERELRDQNRSEEAA